MPDDDLDILAIQRDMAKAKLSDGLVGLDLRSKVQARLHQLWMRKFADMVTVMFPHPNDPTGAAATQAERLMTQAGMRLMTGGRSRRLELEGGDVGLGDTLLKVVIPATRTDTNVHGYVLGRDIVIFYGPPEARTRAIRAIERARVTAQLGEARRLIEASDDLQVAAEIRRGLAADRSTHDGMVAWLTAKNRLNNIWADKVAEMKTVMAPYRHGPGSTRLSQVAELVAPTGMFLVGGTGLDTQNKFELEGEGGRVKLDDVLLKVLLPATPADTDVRARVFFDRAVLIFCGSAAARDQATRALARANVQDLLSP